MIAEKTLELLRERHGHAVFGFQKNADGHQEIVIMQRPSSSATSSRADRRQHMLVTSKELKKVSSPAQSPQYTMTISGGTCCAWKGNGIVVADISKVIGGNDHDLQRYHIWIYESEVEEVDDAMGCWG